MARLEDDGKELKFVGLKDLARHYAEVRNRLEGRQRVIDALKPRSCVMVAHFIEPMRFAFTNEDPEDIKVSITIIRIIRVVCKYFKVEEDVVRGPGRSKDQTMPRHIAIYLCHELTPNSYPQIGRKFGGRDHTTCIHAVRKITQMVQQGGAVKQDVEHLRATLEV